MAKDKSDTAAPAPENTPAKDANQGAPQSVKILEEIQPEVGAEVEFNAQAGRSTDMRRFSTALARAQGMITNAHKSSDNPHFKTKYADLAEIADACRAALSANQISWEQIPKFTESEIWLETILTHGPSGQYRIGRWPIPSAARGKMQDLMAAFTYARRGSLAMMVGVVSEDDDDGNATQAIPGDDMNQDRQPEPPRETKAQAAAAQWASGAINKINTFKDRVALTEWENDPKRQESLVDLRRVSPDWHTKVMDAIQAKQAALGGGETPANG